MHLSFSLIRYLYIPIGGSKRPLVATLVVFTFVALWHDLSLKLLVWGWGISLFVLPEMICTHIIPYKKVCLLSIFRSFLSLSIETESFFGGARSSLEIEFGIDIWQLLEEFSISC